jgi:hypothetical protein
MVFKGVFKGVSEKPLKSLSETKRESILVSPSGMVETPRLEAKRNMAKCEQSEHEPTLVLSYSPLLSQG